MAMKHDDDFWARLHGAFTDAEIVDLGICCALWLGSGRLMSVLDVAQTCSLTLHAMSRRGSAKPPPPPERGRGATRLTLR